MQASTPADDLVRQRIMRQNPRPSALSANIKGQLEKLPSSQDGIQIKNRFQHRNKSLSYGANISTGSARNDLIVSTSHSGSNGEATRQIDLCSGNRMSSELQNCVLLSTEKTVSDPVPSNVVCNGTDNFCKGCGEYDSIVLENNIKRCTNCMAFSLAKDNSCSEIGFVDDSDISSEKGLQSTNSSDDSKVVCPVSNDKRQLGEDNNGKRKKSKGKAYVKDKVCLTISSDEEDFETEEDINSEKKRPERVENIVDKEPTARNSRVDSSRKFEASKFSDRMKLQGSKASSAKEKELTHATCNDSVADLAESTKLDIPINIIKFGALDGKAISTMHLEGNVLKIDIECSYPVKVEGENKRTTEKYKLAMGKLEIEHIIINDDREPLIICIVPSKFYSGIVNNALGKSIFDAESDEAAKKQIIFFVDEDNHTFSRTIKHHMSLLEEIADVHKIDHLVATELICSLSEQSQNETKQYSTRSKLHRVNCNDVYVRNMFVYPPPPQKGGITITTVDVGCLSPGLYVNDTIIDFYLKYLVEEKLDKEMKEKTYLFNSYFYTRLAKKLPCSSDKSLSNGHRMHMQVKKWTRNVDIFEKEYIIIPVNEHAHWYLVIICFPSLVEDTGNEVCSMDVDEPEVDDKINDGNDSKSNEMPARNISPSYSEKIAANTMIHSTKPVTSSDDVSLDLPQHKTSDVKEDSAKKQPCILIFDSLVSGGRSRVFSNLRQYLTIEWKEKRGKTHAEKTFNKNNIKGSFPKIPLQNNDCDCGVYVLQFAESFFKHPIVNYKPPIKKQDWFTKELIENKRNQIKNLIIKLEKDYATNDTLTKKA